MSPRDRASAYGFGSAFQPLQSALGSVLGPGLALHLDVGRQIGLGDATVTPGDSRVSYAQSFSSIRAVRPELLNTNRSINFHQIELALLPVVNAFGEGVERHQSDANKAEITTRPVVTSGDRVTRSYFLVRVTGDPWLLAGANAPEQAVVDVEYVVEWRFNDSTEWHQLQRKRDPEDPLMSAVLKRLG